MISRMTLIVAAGMLLGASAVPVKAADLGGGCCGDLEERVAELEATTARKGNRVVSLQVYGVIATGLMVWDNGEDSDAYIVDNDAITSILGFTGKAAIKPGWTAGYKMELGVQTSVSSLVTEGKNGDDANGNDNNIAIRYNYVYIESDRLGRVSLGQQSTASDGATEISLANVLISSSPDHGTALHPGGFDIVNGLNLGQYASDFDGGRDDLIRYDTPTIWGFTLSATWGDNDYWDIALRFAKEFNSVKVAAAIAYADDRTGSSPALADPVSDNGALGDAFSAGGFSFTQVIGSISVMHVPTGLFVNFGAGERDYDDIDLNATHWGVQAGIERRWMPYGKTTLYGEFGEYKDIVQADTTADMWGVGIVQHFDSAALDLYAQARHWDIDDDNNPEADELSTIMLGAMISF
jgi:predicted porin